MVAKPGALFFAENRLRFAENRLRFAENRLRFAENRLRFAENRLRFAENRLRYFFRVALFAFSKTSRIRLLISRISFMPAAS